MDINTIPRRAVLHCALGIAHTRWATHGKPAERNAHPHMSGVRVAVVHNGIIENHNKLRDQLLAAGFTFSSETDTEVVAHLLAHKLESGQTLLQAVQEVRNEITGAYALAAASPESPDSIVVTREGSPLVIGVGEGENFIGSDVAALKLKEISYIHAEAYPAGELEHAPLALVDSTMPVVCALPNDPLLEKILSNLQEVRTRGGELFLIQRSYGQHRTGSFPQPDPVRH